MLHARVTTLTFLAMYLSPPEAKILCRHNFHSVKDNLIIHAFSRDIYQAK